MRTPVAQGVARELPPPVPLYSQVPEVKGSEETVTSIQETVVETGHPKYSKRDVIVTRDPFYTCPMGFNFEGKFPEWSVRLGFKLFSIESAYDGRDFRLSPAKVFQDGGGRLRPGVSERLGV